MARKKLKIKFFPWIYFGQMSDSKEARHIIENMDGVISFVGPNGAHKLSRKMSTRILGEVMVEMVKKLLWRPTKLATLSK